jgi:hypothetical protein
VLFLPSGGLLKRIFGILSLKCFGYRLELERVCVDTRYEDLSVFQKLGVANWVRWGGAPFIAPHSKNSLGLPLEHVAPPEIVWDQQTLANVFHTV